MNNYEIDGNPHEKHPDRNRKLIDALHYLDNYLACIFKVTVDVKQNNIGEVTYYTYRSFLNLCNPKSDDPYVDRFLPDKIMTGYAIEMNSTNVTDFGFRSIDELCEALMKANSSRFINIGVKENRIKNDSETIRNELGEGRVLEESELEDLFAIR